MVRQPAQMVALDQECKFLFVATETEAEVCGRKFLKSGGVMFRTFSEPALEENRWHLVLKRKRL